MSFQVGILRELSFSIPKTSHSFLQFDPSYNIICPRCPPEHLSVSIQTGFKNLKKPNGCIGGKMLVSMFSLLSIYSYICSVIHYIFIISIYSLYFKYSLVNSLPNIPTLINIVLKAPACYI